MVCRFRAARWRTRWKRRTRLPKSLFGAGNAVVVVKAQIHAGGRGKGGGVKVVKTLDEADAASKAILGMQLGDAPDWARRAEGAAAAD